MDAFALQLNTFLSLGVIVTQVALLIFLLLYVFSRESISASVFEYLKRYGLLFAFLAALVPTLLSLFYSEVVGYTPCKLCWLHRTTFFPLALILGLAWWKKDSTIVSYGIALAFVGMLVATVHYYVEMSGNDLIGCAAEAVSCSRRYIFEFGYVTFAMMAFTSSALVAFFLWFSRKEDGTV